MAKVVAPLGSYEASGKIGQHSVYFNWKGLNVVRKWTKPANPQTESQGDIRTFVGAVGRGTKPVVIPSNFYNDAKAVIPTGMTWVSHIVKTIYELYGGNVTNLSNEFSTVPSAAQNAFANKAADLGLQDFTAPGAPSGIGKALMLYVLYRYGRQMYITGTGKFDRSPYTKAPDELAAADVEDLVEDITTVA